MGSRGGRDIGHALLLAAHGRPGHDVRRARAVRMRGGVVQVRGRGVRMRGNGVQVRSREERLAAVGEAGRHEKRAVDEGRDAPHKDEGPEKEGYGYSDMA